MLTLIKSYKKALTLNKQSHAIIQEDIEGKSPHPIRQDVTTDSTKNSVSFFEFWPGWIMYAPVVIQWVGLSLWHRSLTLPFLANPSLTLSGMVGVPKSELMEQATGLCKAAILPWVTCKTDQSPTLNQARAWIKLAAEKGITLPFVCKPDIGCRGVGVKLIKDEKQLSDTIDSYPDGTSLLCQKLSSWQPEVGIFYVKNPKTNKGEIKSMTSKFLPIVIGDGVSSLGNLIAKDDRAGQLQHLYYERHKDSWNLIPKKDEVIRLVFSASHSKGAIFQNANAYITDELTQAIANIMQDLPNFYYGRLDVKYSNLDALQRGKDLEIIEINAASSESTHIWDKDAKFLDAIKTLLWQYRTLFNLGAYHRRQGKKTPTIGTFISHLLKERSLSKYYPLTD